LGKRLPDVLSTVPGAGAGDSVVPPTGGEPAPTVPLGWGAAFRLAVFLVVLFVDLAVFLAAFFAISPSLRGVLELDLD
jgi:hypothetical protein